MSEKITMQGDRVFWGTNAADPRTRPARWASHLWTVKQASMDQVRFESDVRLSGEALDGIVALIRESRQWQAGPDPLQESLGYVGRLIGELGDCKDTL